MELSLNQHLTGQAGKLTRLRDAKRQGIDSRMVENPRPGTDFAISLDERLQYAADRALARAAEEHEFDTGSLVLMDALNGEILAMASYPTFDPNARRVTEHDVAARRNNAITAPFEPGSVFKVVTFAAALETTPITPEDPIECGSGVMSLFGRRIHDIHPYGTIPMGTVLAKSSNIGAIQIALQTGEARLLEYVKRFGFGRRTGIALPGEEPGLVRELDRWGRTSIGSVAMGHEITATTLQLAVATSAIASEGLLRKPRLILWRQKPGEERQMEPLEAPRRVIQPETSLTLRRLMEGVVLEGTGKRAKLLGYTTGGKTGSAQIYDPKLGHYTEKYNSSYVGFAPLQEPKVVVAVTLNGATKYGGVVAAPVFREVATEALRILGVVPDIPVPDEPSDDDWDDEEFADVAIASLGEPIDIEAESGDAGAEFRATAYLWGPPGPDLYGLALRSVMRECSRASMEVDYEGAGLVRIQHPPPGAVLPVGGRIRVVLAR
ncbi:MAG: hypothetical protein GY953_04990 [bacterium]|nr:hypothetical protein [bacterium]